MIWEVAVTDQDWLDRIERRYDLWRGVEVPQPDEVVPDVEWIMRHDVPALIREVRRLRGDDG